MERELFKKLKEWKNDPERKPLILKGARQVGKTWLLKRFGTAEFPSVAYLNCEQSTQAAAIF